MITSSRNLFSCLSAVSVVHTLDFKWGIMGNTFARALFSFPYQAIYQLFFAALLSLQVVSVFTCLIEWHLTRLLCVKIMHCCNCFVKQRGSDKATGCLLLSARKLLSRKRSVCLIHAEIPVNQQGIFTTHREMMDLGWRIAALVFSLCIALFSQAGAW